MSPELDALLARQGAPVVTHRSAASVNHALHSAAQDDTREFRLYVVRDGSGAPVGYFILKRKVPPLLSGRFKGVQLGAMQDWRIFDEDKVDVVSMALAATAEFFAWGGDAFMAVLPGDENGRVMRRLGYGSSDPLYTLFHADPSSPLAGDEFKQQRAWRFTAAEADGLFI